MPAPNRDLGTESSGSTHPHRDGNAASAPSSAPSDAPASRHAYDARRAAPSSAPQNSPRRAYNLLRAGIRSGLMRPNQPLDEGVIARGFGTSRNSVRHALRMLAADGLVVRQTRYGTAVSGHIAELPIINVGADSVASAISEHGGDVTHEIVDVQFIPSTRVIRDRLATEEREVLLIESVLRAGGEPLYVSVGYICVGDLARDDLVARVHELYRAPRTLDESMLLLYGKRFGHARTSIEAVPCDARSARLLGVSEGAPTLFRDRVLFDEDGRPRDLSFTHLRGDRAALTADIFRENP